MQMSLNSRRSFGPADERSGAGHEDDPDMRGDATPVARVLRAVECLTLSGAITLDDLSQRLDMSKTATWRLVANLRDAGWVRLKQGNRLIELHHRVDEIFSRAIFSDEEFVGLSDLLPDVAAEMSMHLDLVCLANNGTVQLIDTTRRWRGNPSVVMDALDQETFLVMRSAMSATVLARHLAAWESQEQWPAAFGPGLSSIRNPSVLWNQASASLNLALRGRNGTLGALRVSGRRRRLVRDNARRIVARLIVRLGGEVNFIETSFE